MLTLTDGEREVCLKKRRKRKKLYFLNPQGQGFFLGGRLGCGGAKMVLRSLGVCEVHKRQEMGRIINRTLLLGFTAVKHGNSCPQSNTTTLQRVADTGGW